MAALPEPAAAPWHEPSDLAGIQAARPPAPALPPLRLTAAEQRDKVAGAWLGRIAGCLLGKPIEGWHSTALWPYLKESGHWPLAGYLHDHQPTAAQRATYRMRAGWPFFGAMDAAPEDDDTNYTTLGLAVMRQHGHAFTPCDIAAAWLQQLPLLHTFTAERIAYRNLAQMVPPPQSARHCNPYREWIGAQIRADFFGYVAPGDPARAAAYAWRDACVSHIKNGIYGELWVAAMLAAAWTTADLRLVLEAGLAQIPARCRLAAAVRETMAWHAGGVLYDEAVARLHQRWDERRAHHWCHTISNAQIVTLGLLYGEYDYGRSVCRAVQPCFDTDCNGATVGSIIGLMHGAQRLPERWTAPLHGTLRTGLADYLRVPIAHLVDETLAVLAAHGQPQ
jgi:hypothetical protein